MRKQMMPRLKKKKEFRLNPAFPLSTGSSVFHTFSKCLLHVWPWARHWPLLLNGSFREIECLGVFLKRATGLAPRRESVFFSLRKGYLKHTDTPLQ